MPITISLSTDGSDIFVKLSRELEEGENLYLLRRGRTTTRGFHGGQLGRKWIGYGMSNTGYPLAIDRTGRVYEYYFPNVVRWNDKKDNYVKIRKSNDSRYGIPLIAGNTARICFGIAVYKDVGSDSILLRDYENGKKNVVQYDKFKRQSNVAYFRSNVKVTKGDGVGAEWEQWFSV